MSFQPSQVHLKPKKETELFTSDLGYNVCVVTNTIKKYYIVAQEDGSGTTCKITMDGNQIFTRQNC